MSNTNIVPAQPSPSRSDAFDALRKQLCPKLQYIFDRYLRCLTIILAELPDPEVRAACEPFVDELKHCQTVLVDNIDRNLLAIEEVWIASDEDWRRHLVRQAALLDRVTEHSPLPATASQ